MFGQHPPAELRLIPGDFFALGPGFRDRAAMDYVYQVHLDDLPFSNEFFYHEDTKNTKVF
jgi:hypothetical protein